MAHTTPKIGPTLFKHRAVDNLFAHAQKSSQEQDKILLAQTIAQLEQNLETFKKNLLAIYDLLYSKKNRLIEVENLLRVKEDPKLEVNKVALNKERAKLEVDIDFLMKNLAQRQPEKTITEYEDKLAYYRQLQQPAQNNSMTP